MLALAPADDGSSSPLNLGFSVRFGWNEFSSVYVNNNGNITFGTPMASFSPYEPSYLGDRMITPFFADVDTRAGNGAVTWGSGTRDDGVKFFCATWREVGYYNTSGDKRNTFQVILTQSPAQAPSKSMTITFNYDKIEWETGDASQGEDGFGGRSALAGWFDGIEIGSTVAGSMVPGSLLDSNPETGLIHQVHGGQAGRIQYDYSYAEAYPSNGALLDFPTGDSDIPIEVCEVSSDACFWKRSYLSSARFRAVVAPGKYRIASYPRAGGGRSIRQIETHQLESGQVWSVTLSPGPTLTPPAEEITVDAARLTATGVPVLTTADPISIALPTCADQGNPSITVNQNTGEFVGSFPMSADPEHGTRANLPPGSLEPGEYFVTVNRECGDEGAETLTFGLYVTPTVLVVNQQDKPIAGAEVTLLRADSDDESPQVLDPDTDFLTPASRVNPLLTSSTGVAGWSTRMGNYQVEASAEFCADPADRTQPKARSERFRVDLNHPAPDPVKVTMFCTNVKPDPEKPVDPAPIVEPEPSLTGPVVALNLKGKCLRPSYRPKRRGNRAAVPLRASLRVSRRARVNLLIERREIAPRRFRCRNVNKPPLRRSAFRRVGRITRTLGPGRFQLRLPVAAPKRAQASAARIVRLPLQRLRPGTYRITATATDRHGTSKPVRTQFIVLAPKR